MSNSTNNPEYKKYLQTLLEKYRNGVCSNEELEFIEEWYDRLNENNDAAESTGEPSHAQLKEQMWARIMPELEEKKHFRWTRKMMYLAGVVVLIVGLFGVLVFVKDKPGKQNLSYVTLTSLKGEVKKVVLPDETIVWLNSNTTIKYPADFKLNREVYLTAGEAFFHVVHDAEHPFNVRLPSGITAQDLGTEFSVKCYPAFNMMKVNVLKGKVAVRDSAVVLSELIENEGVIFDRTTKKVTRVSVENNEINGWVNGVTVLNNVSFNELALAIENSFKVSLKYNQESFSKCRITISFKAADKLKSILDDMALIHNFKYAIDKDQVLISGTACR